MSCDLTFKQASLLASIKSYYQINKRPPTIREISAMNGISSTNGAQGHLLALQRKGYINITPKLARGITIKNEE